MQIENAEGNFNEPCKGTSFIPIMRKTYVFLKQHKLWCFNINIDTTMLKIDMTIEEIHTRKKINCICFTIIVYDFTSKYVTILTVIISTLAIIGVDISTLVIMASVFPLKHYNIGYFTW